MDTIKQKVQALKNSPGTVAVMYFMLRNQTGLYLKKVEVSIETQRELTAEVLTELDIYFNEPNIVIRDLTNADQRDNAIYRYDLNETPEQLLLIKHAQNDQGQIDDFDHNADLITNLKAIILTIGDGQHTLAIYKHHYPTNTFRRTGFSLWRAGMAQDRFEKLDQDIVRLSHSIDFFYDGIQLYVTNFKVLEKFFGFKEAIKQQAASEVAQLTNRNLISNIADISHRITQIGDITFAKKVIRAISHSPVLQSVTNDQIIQFIKAHHTLGKKIKTANDDTQLLLDTQISQNFFMKLLNDDFLKSELTKFEYDADSKDIFEAETSESAVA
jgi:hypothetical protein